MSVSPPGQRQERKARELNPHLLAENHVSSVVRRPDIRLPPKTQAPPGGLEPPTFRLTAGGSTFELQRNDSGDDGNRTHLRLLARQSRRPLVHASPCSKGASDRPSAAYGSRTRVSRMRPWNPASRRTWRVLVVRARRRFVGRRQSAREARPVFTADLRRLARSEYSHPDSNRDAWRHRPLKPTGLPVPP